jgi:hypothetical protein
LSERSSSQLELLIELSLAPQFFISPYLSAFQPLLPLVAASAVARRLAVFSFGAWIAIRPLKLLQTIPTSYTSDIIKSRNMVGAYIFNCIMAC